MKYRFSGFILILLIISGCLNWDENGTIDNGDIVKEVNVMENISILTEAFKPGENIPEEYTCSGKNVSPVLSWKEVPEGTKSIALIMDDPDAPMGTFVHWVIYNIPSDTRTLPRGVKKSKTLEDGSRQGKNDFGNIGYGGPCPPPGKPHRYFFKIYALDTELTLDPGASKKGVEKALDGHILAKGELMGKYKR